MVTSEPTVPITNETFKDTAEIPVIPSETKQVPTEPSVPSRPPPSPTKTESFDDAIAPSNGGVKDDTGSNKDTMKATVTGKDTDNGAVPGAFEGKSPTSGNPAWYKLGWTSFSSLPNPGNEEIIDELAAKLGLDHLHDVYAPSRKSDGRGADDVLAQFLSEALYGDWYHNTVAIFGTVVSTWLFTKLGFGLMGCLVTGAFMATYYQTSIRRFRRNVRDDLQREMMKTRLETDAETAGWINNFMSRFWLIYEPVLSAQITETVDAILVDNTPSFLDSIRLTKFTLGMKAPQIENIKTYPRTAPNVVEMDWEFSFSPSDALDLTRRELQSRVNPKIVLTIRVGKGMIGAGMPILLEDISFSGKIRLKFKLFNEFPHVKSIEASFHDRPHIDYSLKPIGGETFGFDINNIPGLQTFIQDQIHASLGPMMYDPNIYKVDVAAMMSGAVDLNAVNGVLALTIHSASNLKSTDLLGSLDPYLTMHVGNANTAEVAQTKAYEDTSHPKFDETHFILLRSVDTSVYLQVMDRNIGRKDTVVGGAVVDLKDLPESDNRLDNLNLTVLRHGKAVGEVKCSAHYFATLKHEKLEDGTLAPMKESKSGILKFTLYECKELGNNRMHSADVNTYAIIKADGEQKLKTHIYKRSTSPRWDKSVEIFVNDKTSINLEVVIMNSKEFGEDEMVGHWKSTLVDVEQNIAEGQDWWFLDGGAGKLHLATVWSPVDMTGFISGIGHGSYSPPIGVVRVHFFGAKDLRNVESLTGGKSDPYVRIMSGIQTRAQTDYILDNLDPEWNTALYVPVHSIHEDLRFEVMDYNDIQKDKLLGITNLVLRDIVQETTVDETVVYEAKEPLERHDHLTNQEKSKEKGVLHYAVSFYPALSLPTETEEKKEENPVDEQDQTKEPATPIPVLSRAMTRPEKDMHGELVKYSDNGALDLLSCDSGILSVTIYEATVPTHNKVLAEILLDSNEPQYRTVPERGPSPAFKETGDVFVKEMEFSKLVVRIKHGKDEKDDSHIGFWSSSVRTIIRQLQEHASNDPENQEPFIQEHNLLECEHGTIKLGFSFQPVVRFKLNPSESLENQGTLVVTPIRASKLKGVDRSGTSDPYVVFKFRDEKVHKTEVYKKKLEVKFDSKEEFVLPVQNRVGAKLQMEIYDWDQIGKHELLDQGEVSISGEDLESFAAKTNTIAMKGGAELVLRMVWQPQLLARKRTGTSLISATTRAFTQMPNAGLSFATNVFGKLSNTGSTLEKKQNSLFTLPGSPTLPRQETQTSSSTTSSGTQPTASDENTYFKISIVEARNLKGVERNGTSDPYAHVRAGKSDWKTEYIDKTLNPIWNKSFVTKLGPQTTTHLDIKVRSHNTLKDDDIGSCSVDLANYIQSSDTFDQWIPLVPEGTGEIHVVATKTDSDQSSVRSGRGLFGRR